LLQRTIKKVVEAVGIGLHSGKPVRIRLEPMDADGGIIFYRSDKAVTIPLAIESVVDTTMATVIGNTDKSTISTIEHFLSVLYAYGIDNLRIVIDSNEMPIMDGSAISYCLLLDEAGVVVQNRAKKVIRVKKRISVKDGDKFVELEPSSSASFNFEIDFAHPAIERQSFNYKFGKISFIEEIARARTFGFARDIQYLQSRNLALGASLKNAIGLDSRGVLNSEGLRFENEFVRHKILDAIGDMMVSGFNILGRYSSYAGGHKLNNALLKKLFSSSMNYDIVSMKSLQNPVYEKSFA